MIVLSRPCKPPNMINQPPPIQPPPIQPPPLSCFHHAFLLESMFSPWHTIPGQRRRQKSHKTAKIRHKKHLKAFPYHLLKSSCIPLVWRLFHHGIKNVLVTLSMYPIFDRWSGLTDGQSLTTGQFSPVNQFACQGTLRPSRNRGTRNIAFCAFCESLSVLLRNLVEIMSIYPL